MPRDYKIKALAAENTALAYPLIQSAWPEVTLDAWLSYANNVKHSQPTADKTSGIIVAESARGYIHGLFSYSVKMVLVHGSALSIENFVAVDIGDRAAAIKTLIAGMDKLAQDLGCSSIHTQISDQWVSKSPRNTAIPHHLRNAGHNVELVQFCKKVCAN